MTAAAVWFGRWQWLGGASALTGMLGGMFVGMTWGVVLYRSFFKWLNCPQAAELPGLRGSGR